MQAIIDNLLRPTPDEVYYGSWKNFLFNVEGVRQLSGHAQDDAAKLTEVLHAGVRWEGQGCNTGYCSKKLFDTSGVTHVSSEFMEYLNCFLFSLCIFWQVDVLQLSLPDK